MSNDVYRGVEADGVLLERLSPRPPKPRPKMFFGKLAVQAGNRRKSTGQEFLRSKSLPSVSPSVGDPEPQVRRVTRSQSNANADAFKAQWADALISQQVANDVNIKEPMQASLTQLRQTVEAYEKQASSEKWGELWRIQADVEELDTLAREVLEKQRSRRTPCKGLERFSTVALEYSKLLDVVMNQCPEYVALAWGVMKLLLVANINHSRLKQNIESHLISIGEQLGLVNQLIAYAPTDKMVEAVALLYASFSKFLGKALRCYAKNKIASVIEAFAFPWEAKFEKVVSQIDVQIRRIQELASASHFHATICNQTLLRSLLEYQQEQRGSSQQESPSKKLQMEIKEEMKNEIEVLLKNFDSRWVHRFDELLLQQTAGSGRTDYTGGQDATDSNTQLNLPVSTPQVYLADFVSSPHTLLEFRNEAFPQLQRFDHREDYIRAGSRLLTTYDWQHCVALLRHPSMRSWMSTERSGILWIDTYQGHKLDWASVFSQRLADDCARLEHSVTLAHFCQGHSTGNAFSTAAILIQSLISKCLSLHREQLAVRTLELTQERFQDARNDVEKLWALFLDILRLSVKEKHVWIFIDHVDFLQKETNLKGLENTLALLGNLNALTDDPAMTVKILITARIRDATRLSTKIAEARILASRHAFITVPRGHHRSEATLLAKSSKKIPRLSEPSVPSEVPTSLVSVDTLLFDSDSECDCLAAGTPKTKHIPNRESDAATARREVDCVTEESDSASLFDPLASSDDSESIHGIKATALRSCSSEDSINEDFTQTKPFGGFAKEVKWDSTDDDDHSRKHVTSPLTPKHPVKLSEHSPRSRSSGSISVAGEKGSSAKEKEAPPGFSTLELEDFGRIASINSNLLSDSDSDDSSV